MRIIAEYDPLGRTWNAFYEGQPEATFGGPTPLAAVRRLLEADRPAGLDLAGIAVDEKTSTIHRKVYMVREPVEKVCSECGGTGRYVGLNVVEVCRACGGGGAEKPARC